MSRGAPVDLRAIAGLGPGLTPVRFLDFLPVPLRCTDFVPLSIWVSAPEVQP